MGEISEKLEILFAAEADAAQTEIVDIEYVKESGKRVIRVFIDKPSGINIDDCAHLSHKFSTLLEESQMVSENYVLEVSSPGIDRVVKKEKDFIKFKGQKIKLQTVERINNQRNFLGIIENFENGVLTLRDVTNGAVQINFENIQKAKLEPDF
ncbi:MAG: ribosome maturation factor RimP [Elusimicrobia bacterium]|nr:ribosome maturation factor RimP [Elusimicrobiota bacterium]